MAEAPAGKTGRASSPGFQESKETTRQWFLDPLLQSDVADEVARVVLFGSVARGKFEPESDIDVYVEALEDVELVRPVCLDLSFEIMRADRQPALSGRKGMVSAVNRALHG